MASEVEPLGARAESGRRERILAVAAEEFARRGRGSTRVDEIARRARVNKQLIYYYYDSKDGLYSAVLAQMVERAGGLWAAMREAELHAGIALLLDYAEDPVADWRRLLLWEGLEYGAPEEEYDIILMERRARSYQIEIDLFRRAQAKGDLDPALDPSMLALLFTLLSLSRTSLPQVITMMTGLDANSDEYADRLAAFVSSILARLSASGGSAPE